MKAYFFIRIPFFIVTCKSVLVTTMVVLYTEFVVAKRIRGFVEKDFCYNSYDSIIGFEK
jgi:hypothetical protein